MIIVHYHSDDGDNSQDVDAGGKGNVGEIEMLVIDILVTFHSHFVNYGVWICGHLKTSHMKV